jgi:hypothetical protein
MAEDEEAAEEQAETLPEAQEEGSQGDCFHLPR